MKHVIATTSLASALLLSSSILFAGDRYHNDYDRYNYDQHRYSDFKKDNRHRNKQMARVIDVNPIYTRVRVATPHQQCQDRPRRHSEQSYTSTIAGGLLGGVIGNQFGKGSGKTAMTVAGTLLGGSLGKDYTYGSSYNNRRNHNDYCQVSNRYHYEQRIEGYHVTYSYNGQTYTTEMDHHPGKRIPVNVSVSPAFNHKKYSHYNY